MASIEDKEVPIDGDKNRDCKKIVIEMKNMKMFTSNEAKFITKDLKTKLGSNPIENSFSKVEEDSKAIKLKDIVGPMHI